VERLKPALLQKWFVPSGSEYAICKSVRTRVVFGVNNLVSDAPISQLDVLLCRNVLIYLDSTLQNQVLSRFHYALRPSGILVLGQSELIPFASDIFEPIDVVHRVYAKDSKKNVPPLGDTDRVIGLVEELSLARDLEPPPAASNPNGQLRVGVLDSLPLPAIVTELDGTVSGFNLAASQLWGRTEAETIGKKLASLELPGFNDDLLIEKKSTLPEEKDEPIRADWFAANRGGAQLLPSVEVSVVRGPGGEEQGFLYTAHDVTALRGMEAELRRVREERKSFREELQSTNEELQSTNQELQSANEELRTTNEELQSTNDELQTANQELQSANQELDATNRELAYRTGEASLLSLCQRAIMQNLSAAIAILDPHGRITLWNLAAQRLLGLVESEAIGQFIWNLRLRRLDRSLLGRIRRSLTKRLAFRAEEVEYNLPTGAKGYATVVALPLLDEEFDLGSVIIFEDGKAATPRVRKLGRHKAQGKMEIRHKRNRV
jgi:two-component system CheB/CheR fusion protein